jgi:hypothetical protein
MSLVDKFDDNAEPAYTRAFDRETARRQLRVSLVLVAAMAAAAFILGFALPLNSPHPTKSQPMAGDADSAFSGRLLSINDR